MAHFFRDEHIKNLTINEDLLIQFNSVFLNRQQTLNEKVPKDDKTGLTAFFLCVIRFDNKGYRLFSIEELLRYFNQGKVIERIIFTVETGISLTSNRQVGSHVELRLDEKDPNNCYLSVTSDDRDWVDSSFSAIKEVIAKCKNKNGLARTAWTQFVVQLTGITLGFIISLWAATKAAPKFNIENSFTISFLFALFIFSNIWTHLSQRLILFIHSIFPNLKFYRTSKDRMHWLMQAVIGGVAAAITLYFLSFLFEYVTDILGVIVNKNA